jgi:hypothetical protein
VGMGSGVSVLDTPGNLRAPPRGSAVSHYTRKPQSPQRGWAPRFGPVLIPGQARSCSTRPNPRGPRRGIPRESVLGPTSVKRMLAEHARLGCWPLHSHRVPCAQGALCNPRACGCQSKRRSERLKVAASGGVSSPAARLSSSACRFCCSSAP